MFDESKTGNDQLACMYQEIKGTVTGQEEPIRREHGQVLIVVVSPQDTILIVQRKIKQMVFDCDIFYDNRKMNRNKLCKYNHYDPSDNYTKYGT